MLCVPVTDPNWGDFEQLEDLPSQLRDEIEWFFSMYKTPEGNEVEVDGWFSRDDAWEEIEASQRRRKEREAGAGEEQAP